MLVKSSENNYLVHPTSNSLKYVEKITNYWVMWNYNSHCQTYLRNLFATQIPLPKSKKCTPLFYLWNDLLHQWQIYLSYLYILKMQVNPKPWMKINEEYWSNLSPVLSPESPWREYAAGIAVGHRRSPSPSQFGHPTPRILLFVRN